MKWKTNSNGSHLKDPGFRATRIVFYIIIILLFTLIIWFGKNYIRSPEPRTLVVYSFSGMQEVMENAILPAFQDYWENKNGEKLVFVTTFSGSGEITNKILARYPAEVAILSSNLDARQLSASGIPATQWQKDLPYHGVISRTPLIMVTREGNPKGIVRFTDLKKPGIKIVFPNPLTSGAGQWGIMAIYGSTLSNKGDKLAAHDVLRGMKKNYIKQPPNAKTALQQFNRNTGNILITYESNILANPTRKQIPGQLVYPPCTVICEHIVLPIEKNITLKQRNLVDSFVQYLWSKEAQEIFVKYGFHSVDRNMGLVRKDFGHIQVPLTVGSLGKYVDLKKFIDESMIKHFLSSRDN